MVHIIGMWQATCTSRILAVLAEKGVTDFTLTEPSFVEMKSPPYLEKQPFGQIPILEDGDIRIHESRAICRYLAAKYHDQGTKLLPDPSDIKGWALFEQWASVEAENWNEHAFPMVNQVFFNKLKGLPVIKEVVDENREKFKQRLVAFDAILAKQKYMGGDEFSLIDIFYYPYTKKLFQIGEGALIEGHPNVKAWWERISTRDAWVKVSNPDYKGPE
ncbi:putative glutathion S-transferase II, GST-II [Bisporella sp. PMI_857]|nr:putative glutathion S-transferase II, GST-II [Bisporella sp. PMI_857]